MLELARNMPGIAVASEDFDQNPWILVVENGTIDLRTGALEPHRREDLCTRLAPVVYDPQATLPLWDRFLRAATNEDEALIAFLQRCAGYSLTGDVSEEKLFFVHGPTGTGKSTFLMALQAALGDYAQTADFETFLAQRYANIRNDIARMRGARMVVSIEVDKGRRLAEGLVKTLIGGDRVAARFLHREHFEFKPQMKLWLVANDAPKMRDDDSALWRRVLRVPFEHMIPEDERDPSVKATLTNPALSGAAIIAWAVQGCLLWQQYRLAIPPVVRAATESLRAENDPLRDFWTDCCVFSPTAIVTSNALWSAYIAWATENGARAVNRQEFADRLRRLGIRDHKGAKGVRMWIGIRINTGGEAGGEVA
jgi:putative DNA primase/helicase